MSRQKSMVCLLVMSVLFVAACGTPSTGNNTEGTLQVSAAFADATVSVGENKLHIQVNDAQGQALSGCTLTVQPQMSIHGHGSSQAPVISEEATGHFHVKVFFQMKGPWEIKVRAEHGELFGEKIMQVDVQ
ncbi:MAG: FixH family protein [Myxococcales bacterium]|nr:FixH family protein [Myxococcales bacterium]MCB9644568.1 FixH family protein [Myxococcales bacterium]